MLVDIYVRVSTSRAMSEALHRQETDCRFLAASHGWHVRAVHMDDGRSAFGPGASQPGLSRMLAAVAAGVVDGAVVWRIDRLSRQGGGAIGSILEVFNSAGARLVTVMDGFDSVTDDDSKARQLGDAAHAESETLGQRVRSAHAHNRANGRFVVGATPYGLRRRGDGRVEPDPAQASRLRAMLDMVLEGQSLVAAVRWANEQGWEAPRGGVWQVTTLSQLVRNPVIAGLAAEAVRDARGRPNGRTVPVIDGETGCPVRIGQGILTEEERQRLLAGLRPASTRGEARSVLLRGLLFCGSCGSPTHVFARAYNCSSPANGRPCAAPAAAYVPAVDRATRQLVVARLRELDASQRRGLEERILLVSNPLVAIQVAAIDEALTSPHELSAKRQDGLRQRREALTAGLILNGRRPSLSRLVASGLDGELRSLVSALVSRVELTPGGGRGRRFQPERLLISWSDV